MNQTVNDIKNRRSIRKYKTECPPAELIDQIIEAGTCAPSGMGQQSAIIIAVTDKAELENLSRLNAQVRSQSGDPFYGAPAILLVLAKSDSPYCVQDGSLVMGNLMNAAYALGLGSCWINRFKEVFELPEGRELLKKWNVHGEYTGVGGCILGYPAEKREMKPRKDNYVYYIR